MRTEAFLRIRNMLMIKLTSMSRRENIYIYIGVGVTHSTVLEYDTYTIRNIDSFSQI